MTSKHCFSKIMREDFRHKTWMLALSILGNLLALPVAFLMSTGRNVVYETSSVNVERLTDYAEQIELFFSWIMCITGGIIAIAGALIVGLFGFRFVFHRNMVDTYHSIPVKRRTLFLAGWLNGFLIWFLPFLVNLVVTVILGESRLSSLRKTAAAIQGMDAAGRQLLGTWPTGGGLILNALLSTFALIIAFLLIYHLVLLAVMLSGNVLNTLVTTALLGGGALSVYGIFFLFHSVYLDTFMSIAHRGYTKLLYASPIVSSVYVLYRRVEAFAEVNGTFAGTAVLNLLIAAGLGILALAVYLKRPSELAEQGIFCKPVRLVLQIVASVVAAMSGWVLFDVLTKSVFGMSGGIAWGVFGALMAGIVVFGVMDIIFHMDFKAFFAHKALMAAVMGVSLLVCFAFCLDWWGYDGYLPKEEDIAEIAVYDYNRTNRNYYNGNLSDENYLLEQVHIADQAAAYAFLEDALDYMENGFPEDYVASGNSCNNESIYVKVTLKSGRSYYRIYFVNGYIADSACALLASPEYLNANFRLSDEDVAAFYGGRVSRNDMSYNLNTDTEKGRAAIAEICAAYNQDLEDSPDIFIRDGGRLLCMISLPWDGPYTGNCYLEVYEEMHHTVEALRQLGLGDFVEPMEAEEVQEIVLNLNYWYSGLGEGFNLVEAACSIYGVYPEGLEVNEYVIETSDVSAFQTECIVEIDPDEEIVLHITAPEEIEELLELVSYQSIRHDSGVFRPRQVNNITLVGEDGSEYRVYIPRGALPEKYILRFVQLQEELLQSAE